MKKFLVITQILYALSLAPWLLMMIVSLLAGLDQDASLLAVALLGSVVLYPVVAIVCSVSAWILRKRGQRYVILVNLGPLLWIVCLVLPLLANNFSELSKMTF